MTDDQILEVVQAHKEGKKIQWRDAFYHTAKRNTWEDLISDTLTWDFRNNEYRVAPEPRKPREWWLEIRADGSIRPASADIKSRNEFVHVREVLE